MKTLVSVMGQPCRFERALATNVSHPKTDALCRNKLSVGPLAVIDAPENETALDFRTGDLSGSGKYQKGVRSIVLGGSQPVSPPCHTATCPFGNPSGHNVPIRRAGVGSC
jgi:hypothetical protein